MTASSFFFDQQDHELLLMVNRILERDRHKGRESLFFAAELHPHGIKELAVSRELRIAYAVINLLESLEAGEVADRILALRTLHEEVLYTAASSFRRNTARVLIQIMKDLVRAHGFPERQIMLARDFREAASGKRRIVRAMLRRYHLLEMPEEWDQLTFDNHVHDANTKGRKTPTHLIMDAWIKGIRSLTVIYYNFVETRAVQELMQAAEVMGVNIRVGVEFKTRFRNRHVEFIWEPIDMGDFRAIQTIMDEPNIKQLMDDGRSASAYEARYVFAMLQRYNEAHRHDIGNLFGIRLEEISEKDFIAFVAAGQPSLLHLAELAYKRMLPAMEARIPALREQHALSASEEEKKALEALVKRMHGLHPEEIMETWFTPERNPQLPDPGVPATGEDVPEFLHITPAGLMKRLAAARRRSRVTLTLSGLKPEDALELLYDCEGSITHLELFNLKDYNAGRMQHCKEINALQFAINQGSAVALKRQIRGIIRDYGCSLAPDAEERCQRLTEILRNIPKLQSYYTRVPLKTRVGSDSTSRSHRLFGMGFAFIQTLAPSAQKSIKDPKDFLRQLIPLNSDIDSSYVYSLPRSRPEEGPFTQLIRRVPGFRYYGYKKHHDWIVRTSTTRYSEEGGSIATLGGFQRAEPSGISLAPRQEAKEASPGLFYMNTRLANVLKVLVGFALAICTFLYTQQWWVLAWFGAPIWFAITGLRNILQAVLGGGGIRRTPLLRWNDYVSWTRLCDSLLYTGISVPLLELALRWFILGEFLGITASNSPLLFFTIISTANGLYITSHNIYRGLPREAAIGNLFRSILSVPVSLLYNAVLLKLVLMLDMESGTLLMQQGAAIVSKAASDTVAGIIEGFADQNHNLRSRYWDYTYKLQQLFACFARLEVLLPEEDVLDLLQRPRELMRSRGPEVAELEKAILIHALDLMYFWMYQPRARTMLARLVHAMPEEERVILARSQLVLTREREVSQLFVDGIVGNNFPKPLAFFLDRHKEYLGDMARLTSSGQPGETARPGLPA